MNYADTVSVVITTRNRADSLPQALYSALRQTHPPAEVLVVLDGEDVETTSYLATVKDPLVRSIVLPRSLGACSARNAGVKAAIGDWIAFLDDDDEWMTTKLEVQLAVAQTVADRFPVIACRVAASTPGGQTFIWPTRRKSNGEHMSEYLLTRRSWVQGEGLITTSMLLAPRELLLSLPFTTALQRHQEWDWLLRASALPEVGISVAWDVLAKWNIEGNRSSISNGDNWKVSFDWIRSMRHMVTQRAYASFLMVFVSAVAAREGDLAALRVIFREVRKDGKPTPIEYALMAAMWLLPQKTRRRLRNLFAPQAQTA